ncbi:MAG: glycosyltransferase family 4 protein [Cyanobacteria bacterium]|nr:glycosyltransferase family 4 protein [Cyanobacteriota bacterium]
MKKNNVRRFMIITPAFSGGSWIIIERLLEKLAVNNDKIIILGLGKIVHKNKRFFYFSIPYPRYDRWGFIPSLNPLIAFIWNLPLFVISVIFLLIFQPHIVISNGFIPGLSISLFIKILRKRLVIAYHGFIKSLDRVSTSVFVFINKLVDLVIVNSKGSLENLFPFLSSSKICISEHYADDLFFKGSVDHASKRFTILYIGRLDREKLCLPLIEVAERMKDDESFLFFFVGVGFYVNIIKNLERISSNVRYLGYINDRIKLRELYNSSDVIWAFADETYLALPAIESLACGRPIIVPRIAALTSKIKQNVEINKTLVPMEIGWLVDPDNLNEILNLIIKIKEEGISKKMRKNCREYARLHYNSDNLNIIIEKINNLLG